MLALPERLTFADACGVLGNLETVLLQSAPSAEPLRIDGSALKSFDSSAIAVLLACRRAARAAGRDVAISGLPPTMTDLAGLYGVSELLPSTAAQPAGVA